MSLTNKLFKSKTIRGLALASSILASSLALNCGDNKKNIQSIEPQDRIEEIIANEGGTINFQDYSIEFPENTFQDSTRVSIERIPESERFPLPEGTTRIGEQIKITAQDSLKEPVTLKYNKDSQGNFIKYNEQHNIWDDIRTTNNTTLTNQFSLWGFIFGNPHENNNPCGEAEVNENTQTNFELAKNYTDFRCNQWYNSRELLRNYIVEGETPFEIWFNVSKPFMQTLFTSLEDLYEFALGVNFASSDIIYSLQIGKDTANKYIEIAEDINTALQNITDQTNLLEFQMMSAQGRMASELANRSGSITRLLKTIKQEQSLYQPSEVDTSQVINILGREKQLLEEIIQDSYLETRIADKFFPEQFDVELSLNIRNQATADTNYVGSLIRHLRGEDIPQGLTGEIVFVSNRDRNFEIYKMNADGTNQINVTRNNATDLSPSWSPNRENIAFTSDRNGNNDLYTMNKNGNNINRLTNDVYHDVGCSWSPDGTKIVASVLQGSDFKIYTINPDGTNKRFIDDNNQYDNHFPSWSPDGSKIIFQSNRDGNQEIYIMNADGSNPKNLTNNPGADTSPAWSPDGRYIAFNSERDGNLEIYIMNSNGNYQTNLTNHPAIDYGPCWSPDSRYIAFASRRGEAEDDIYIMNLRGNIIQRLTNARGYDYSPDWK